MSGDERSGASPLRRVLDLLSGRQTRDRLASLERLARKFGDAQRDGAGALQARLADIARAVTEQPTAKDLRELRQALRGLAAQSDHRRLFDAVAQIGASDKPILIGPWTGEVGFELLYWIPFVEWARTHGGWARAREVIVSRGGVASWYGASGRYCDALTLVGPEEFRSAIGEERRKQRRPGAFDDRLVQGAVGALGLGDVDILHPSLMYRALASYWNDESGFAQVDQLTRHRLLAPPPGERPSVCPPEYVAVRFYFNECFPETPENRAFAGRVVSALAARTSVVVLNPGFRMDEHSDWMPDRTGRVVTIAGEITPDRNLAVQSAVIAGARAFVGTYGGYSYLAPLYGVPSVAFSSNPAFKLHHLYAAPRVYSQIGAAALTPIDTAQVPVVQLAIGSLVSA